VHHHTLQIN